MRQRLRKLLLRVAILGVGSTQAGCCCTDDYEPTVDVDFDRTSPEIAALIDRCAANPDDCEPLCREALRSELGDDAAMYYEVYECEATPQGELTRVHVEYWDGTACGRAPEGLVGCPPIDADPTTAWLARAAYLEAASVTAFIHLAADLVRLGAPRALAEAAIAAAKDEIRHAALMRSVCRVPVPVPRVPPYRPSTLRDLAMLNAVEGCARETLGAALNVWQAEHLRDPELRTVFAQIAPDEVAHAELAWAIHAWAVGQLDADARAAIIRAQVEAAAEIACSVDMREVLELGGRVDRERPGGAASDRDVRHRLYDAGPSLELEHDECGRVPDVKA